MIFSQYVLLKKTFDQEHIYRCVQVVWPVQELVAILGGVLGFWGGVGHPQNHDHHDLKGWLNGCPLPACADDPEVLLQAQGGQEGGDDDVRDDNDDANPLEKGAGEEGEPSRGISSVLSLVPTSSSSPANWHQQHRNIISHSA